METWKPIPGYSLYEISDMGRIKTFNWKNQGREAIMRPAIDGGGYLRTMLKRDIDGKPHTIKVHRLVLIAFDRHPREDEQCNHINGIRTDNRLCNLEWVTHAENIQHSFRIGLSTNKGENNPAATITADKVIQIRKEYQYGRKSKHDGGPTKKQIAEEYGVSFEVIKNIVTGRTWKHLL